MRCKMYLSLGIMIIIANDPIHPFQAVTTATRNTKKLNEQ